MPVRTTLDKSRLDVLIYSHDGRGLGHVSRGVTLGMTFRRLFPQLRVLFVSGSKQTSTLIGSCPLEWIKLPSYETLIVKGEAKGRIGDINIKNCYLGPARANILESIIVNFKPRCVLVDHEPLGKREELLPALRLTKGTDTTWLLGVRAVIGDVAGMMSALSKHIFKAHYHSLLWYGDDHVLGPDLVQSVEEYFATRPIITGYISRFLEMAYWSSYSSERYAGTIAIPCLSETSLALLEALARALDEIGERYGRWKIFTDMHELKKAANDVKRRFEKIPHCVVENVSDQYLAALANSRVAMVYGGYNSLTDIMAANVPAVVIIRSVNDKEQEEHVNKIIQAKGRSMVSLTEPEITWKKLHAALETQLNVDAERGREIQLNGSERAARSIVELLGLQS
jgi:predicted glycosyltransferase